MSGVPFPTRSMEVELRRAFVRGFAAAVAQTLRRETAAVYLLRSIGATERLLKDAEVDEFDLEELRPILRQLHRRKPRRRT